MQAFRITLTDMAAEELVSFELEAPNLRIALARAEVRLRTLDAGHGTGTGGASVEILGGIISDPETGEQVWTAALETLRALGIRPISRLEAQAGLDWECPKCGWGAKVNGRCGACHFHELEAAV